MAPCSSRYGLVLSLFFALHFNLQRNCSSRLSKLLWKSRALNAECNIIYLLLILSWKWRMRPSANNSPCLLSSEERWGLRHWQKLNQEACMDQERWLHDCREFILGLKSPRLGQSSEWLQCSPQHPVCCLWDVRFSYSELVSGHCCVGTDSSAVELVHS